MLTAREKKFLEEWERDRAAYSSFSSKLLRGLPMALIFSLPIVLFIFVVYLFFPEWYARISNIPGDVFITVLIGVFCSAIFFAYFRMHLKWETNEQLFRELKMKEKDTDA